jgi:hypothetical protein
MTCIDAVTIEVRFSHYFSVGVPNLNSEACLIASPDDSRAGTWEAGVRVGTWEAGVLSLQQPDGDSRRVPYPGVDEAVEEATLTWNTPVGIATLERRIAARLRGLR